MTTENTNEETPVEEAPKLEEEAPVDMPTDSDSSGDNGAEERTGSSIGEALGKLADDLGEQLEGAVDVDQLKNAAKAPGNRALDEWLGMGINFLKGGFESALGKRGKESSDD
jgi:hypothetical protein